MAAGLVMTEALLVGILILFMGAVLVAPVCSTRPDPKMHLLLSLLETLPRDDGEAPGKEEDRRAQDSDARHRAVGVGPEEG